MVNISQVFITENNEQLPPLFEESSNTVKKYLINDNYHLYKHDDINLCLKMFDCEIFQLQGKNLFYKKFYFEANLFWDLSIKK